MDTNITGSGRSSPPTMAYPFALRPDCSDGVAWPENQFKSERLPLDHKKYLEFKLKLGTFLRDQLYQDSEHRSRTYILKDFPEHYHIRQNKRTGHDIDYYIYGHPDKVTKRFDSPKKFFPHLLWLIGGTGDRSLCPCVLCGTDREPKEFKEKLERVSLQAVPSTASSSAPATTLITNTPTTTATPQTSTLQQSTPVGIAPPVTGPATIIGAGPKPTIQYAQQSPFPASVTTNSDKPDAAAPSSQRDEPVIFREGEVVWYKNNNAWRIGIVLKAVAADVATSTPSKCLIKPLAHAFIQLENVLKAETDMRPFLAFSVPAVSMKELQNRRMGEVPWRELQAQYAGDDRQKQELVSLEASKMIVVEIDNSYSTFNSIHITPTDPTKQVVGGVFLGAERISVNEAVRIRLDPTEMNPAWVKGMPIVMVLRQIFITTAGLHFFGDVYRLEETANQQETPYQAQLPPAMLRERAFRNHVKKPAGTRFDWILIQQNQVKPESAVRGRFYETAKLMVILDPGRFQAALNRGVVEDVQAYLNNRLESAGVYLGRRKNRLETLSCAVPEGFFLTLGPGIVESQ